MERCDRWKLWSRMSANSKSRSELALLKSKLSASSTSRSERAHETLRERENDRENNDREYKPHPKKNCQFLKAESFSNLSFFKSGIFMKITQFCDTDCVTSPSAESLSQLAAEVHFCVCVCKIKSANNQIVFKIWLTTTVSYMFCCFQSTHKTSTSYHLPLIYYYCKIYQEMEF